MPLRVSGKRESERSRSVIVNEWMHYLPLETMRSVGSTRASNESNLSRADRQTISVDVRRSSAHWDIHRYMKTSTRISKRKVLNGLVEDLATSISGFRYYQGIHEVCLVVLEVCEGDPDNSYDILVPLLNSHFSHFIKHDFNSCLLPMLDALRLIIGHFSPDVMDVLDTTGVGCHFAVPWILTWFAHSVHVFKDISSIFTFLIHFSDGTDKTMILYLCAAVVISHKKAIMEHKTDMCHVFKSVQSAATTVNMQDAMELARSMKETLPAVLVQRKYPQISFLYRSDRRGWNSLGGYFPAILGVTLAGVSLAVASARSTSAPA